ncbi:unnamed protein product, partial [Staurois parvus]
MGPLCPCPNSKKPMKRYQGNLMGPPADSGPSNGDHRAPVYLPKLKRAYEKDTRGISWGPLLTPGPRAVPEFPNGQSAPGCMTVQLSGKLTQHHIS